MCTCLTVRLFPHRAGRCASRQLSEGVREGVKEIRAELVEIGGDLANELQRVGGGGGSGRESGSWRESGSVGGSGVCEGAVGSGEWQRREEVERGLERGQEGGVERARYVKRVMGMGMERGRGLEWEWEREEGAGGGEKQNEKIVIDIENSEENNIVIEGNELSGQGLINTKNKDEKVHENNNETINIQNNENTETSESNEFSDSSNSSQETESESIEKEVEKKVENNQNSKNKNKKSSKNKKNKK